VTTLRLEKLAHSYKANPAVPQDYALKEINQIWQTGGAYALLGPSGCGKTTLLNILSGLVTPSQGRVYFDDRDVTDLPTEKRNIAQVFQFPVIYDTMTVRENLAFPLKNRGMDATSIKTRVDEIASPLSHP
jgi:glycerol transport system ATP-binding protein